MNLKKYLKSTHRSIMGLTLDLGVSYNTGVNWVKGTCDLTLSRAKEIEKWTEGHVTCEDLYETWLAKKHNKSKKKTKNDHE